MTLVVVLPPFHIRHSACHLEMKGIPCISCHKALSIATCVVKTLMTQKGKVPSPSEGTRLWGEASRLPRFCAHFYDKSHPTPLSFSVILIKNFRLPNQPINGSRFIGELTQVSRCWCTYKTTG